MKDRVVLDSSIWVELERNNKKIVTLVSPYLQKNRVCLVDLIMAEVLRGTRTIKDYEVLKMAFSDFEILTTNWLKVANLAFRVSKKGYQPPLTDLYIAQCIIENKITLITQDKDFIIIQKVEKFNLKMV